MSDFLIYNTSCFTCTPCIDCDVPGYVVLSPDVTANTLGELPGGLLAELGEALATLEHAIAKVVVAEHVYILRFSEGLGTVHFHLFPRTRALACQFLSETGATGDDINGPLLFAWARLRFARPVKSGLSARTLAAAAQIRTASLSFSANRSAR